MDAFKLTTADRRIFQKVLSELEQTLEALQIACAYTSIIEDIDVAIPGIQELHVNAYIPQSYGIITAVGAAKIILERNEYRSELGNFIVGCLDYVLKYFNVAGQNFQTVKRAAGNDRDIGRLLQLTSERAPGIKQHGEEALRLMKSLLGPQAYNELRQAALESQQWISEQRIRVGLDKAPAAFM